MPENEPTKLPAERSAEPAADYAEDPSWFDVDVPEYYTDTVNVNMSNYGLSLTFGLRGWKGPAPKARVFMSHEMARVVHRLIDRILTTYELDNEVTIAVPEGLLAQLRLRDADLAELRDRRSSADNQGNESRSDSGD